MREQQFELREEHIKLLQHANIDWLNMETGAPGIDPKRPYGSSSVAGDVISILDMRFDDNSDADFDRVRDQAMQFHHETLQALQIIIDTRSFELGMYRRVRKERLSETRWEKM